MGDRPAMSRSKSPNDGTSPEPSVDTTSLKGLTPSAVASSTTPQRPPPHTHPFLPPQASAVRSFPHTTLSAARTHGSMRRSKELLSCVVHGGRNNQRSI